MSDQSLILGLTRQDAAHLCAALLDYRRRCQADGMTFPRSLVALTREVAGGVMEGHGGSRFAGPPASRDAAPVAREVLTYQQAAVMLACSTSTVKRRVRTGDLPAVRHGRVVRIRHDDVHNYLNRTG